MCVSSQTSYGIKRICACEILEERSNQKTVFRIVRSSKERGFKNIDFEAPTAEASMTHTHTHTHTHGKRERENICMYMYILGTAWGLYTCIRLSAHALTTRDEVRVLTTWSTMQARSSKVRVPM